MTKDEIEAFVAAMIEAGSNIQAIGTIGYLLAEPVDPADRETHRRIELVSSGIRNETVSSMRSPLTFASSDVWWRSQRSPTQAVLDPCAGRRAGG